MIQCMYLIYIFILWKKNALHNSIPPRLNLSCKAPKVNSCLKNYNFHQALELPWAGPVDWQARQLLGCAFLFFKSPRFEKGLDGLYNGLMFIYWMHGGARVGHLVCSWVALGCDANAAPAKPHKLPVQTHNDNKIARWTFVMPSMSPD